MWAGDEGRADNTRVTKVTDTAIVLACAVVGAVGDAEVDV